MERGRAFYAGFVDLQRKGITAPGNCHHFELEKKTRRQQQLCWEKEREDEIAKRERDER